LFENPELNSELELRMENVRALKNLLLVTLLCWFFAFPAHSLLLISP